MTLTTKNLFYFLFITLLLSLSGISCRQSIQDEKNVFRYNQLDGIETLDPAFAKSLSIMWAVKFVYNTLVEVDSQLHIQPSLAKNWDLSSDGLTYTFHLRTDVFFHNNPIFPNGKGRKMTASDVVYSFNRLIDPQTASAGAWIFNDRVADNEPFKALNDSTLVIRLIRPFKPLPEILSMPYCSIIPHEAVENWGKDFRNHPCGTGPFVFTFWDEGVSLIFHKNPNYWERDDQNVRLPYLDGIAVSFNDTRAIEFLKFQQKELDFMNGIDGSMQDLVLTKKGTLREEFSSQINLKKQTYLNTEYLGIQMANSSDDSRALSNQKVRQAINYAIDRQKIITYFRNGIGQPAQKGFIPLGMPGSESVHFEGYSYQPEKVFKLLKEAGYPEGKGLPPLILHTPDANVDICNFIATNLNELGIATHVSVMQKGLLRQQMSKGELDFFKAQWIADYPDAETFLAVFYSQFPAPPNYTRFKNQQFDRWYMESLQSDNDTERYILYGKMDSLVSSIAPVIPLYYDEILHFTQKNVQGLRSNSLNMIDLKRVKK